MQKTMTSKAPSGVTTQSARKAARAAVQKFARWGKAFSAPEVRAAHPDIDAMLIHQSIQLEIRHGMLTRVSRGTYILEKTAPGKRAKGVAARDNRLLKHLDVPRNAAELGTLLGVTDRAVNLRSKDMIARGKLHSRAFGKKTFFARSKEDLDRKAAQDAQRLHPISIQILQRLPDESCVAREVLRKDLDLGQTALHNGLERLLNAELVEDVPLGTDIHITLTGKGRKHHLRSQGSEERLPPMDWARTPYSARIGTLMILDMMSKLTIAEVGAATMVLSAGYHPARIHQHIQGLIDAGLLAADTSDATTHRRVALTEKASLPVQRIRRFVPYPDRGELERAIDEWRASPNRRRRKAERAME